MCRKYSVPKSSRSHCFHSIHKVKPTLGSFPVACPCGRNGNWDRTCTSFERPSVYIDLRPNEPSSWSVPMHLQWQASMPIGRVVHRENSRVLRHSILREIEFLGLSGCQWKYERCPVCSERLQPKSGHSSPLRNLTRSFPSIDVRSTTLARNTSIGKVFRRDQTQRR